MKTTVFTTIVVAFAILNGSYARVYEFGKERPGDVVIAVVKGSIEPFENEKTVQLDIPRCYLVTNVKVSVSKGTSHPNVDFDGSTNRVTISFTEVQYFTTKFTVTAKGYKDVFCP